MLWRSDLTKADSDHLCRGKQSDQWRVAASQFEQSLQHTDLFNMFAITAPV